MLFQKPIFLKESMSQTVTFSEGREDGLGVGVGGEAKRLLVGGTRMHSTFQVYRKQLVNTLASTERSRNAKLSG